MFFMFFGKKIEASDRGICIVLYSFSFDRNLTESLYFLLIEYFKTNLQVNFRYSGFYDETYKDNYGEIITIEKKLLAKKWNEIVNITLDDESVKSISRTLGIEFNITRPEMITVELSSRYTSFDIENFVSRIHPVFNVIYGFSYSTVINEWASAYANGNWEKTKDVFGIDRISKKHIERWQTNCEKIQDGYIRDIYNENILSSAHLKKIVNEKTLEEYITCNSIGSLHDIGQSLFLWSLNEEQLKKARNLIYKSTIII